MRKKVPVFRQTTDFTCGAAAALMVWRYFDRNVQLSKRNEFLIWTEIAALPFKFSSPYRIAAFFIKKGLETKQIMKQDVISEDIMLLDCCQADPEERKLFFDFFKAHSRILKRSIASTILDRTPTLEDLRCALSNHSLVIVLVDSHYTAKARGTRNPPHLPHWIVVAGCEDETFRINDSAQESSLRTDKIMMKGSLLEKAMDTFPRFGWPSALIVVGGKDK